MTCYLAQKLPLLDVDFPPWSHCHSQSWSLCYWFTLYMECIGAILNFLEFAEDHECLFCVSCGTEHSHISATSRSHYLVFCSTILQYELQKIDLTKSNSSTDPMAKKNCNVNRCRQSEKADSHGCAKWPFWVFLQSCLRKLCNILSWAQ